MLIFSTELFSDLLSLIEKQTSSWDLRILLSAIIEYSRNWLEEIGRIMNQIWSVLNNKFNDNMTFIYYVLHK